MLVLIVTSTSMSSITDVGASAWTAADTLSMAFSSTVVAPAPRRRDDAKKVLVKMTNAAMVNIPAK